MTTLRSARLPWSVGPETTAALHALARRQLLKGRMPDVSVAKPLVSLTGDLLHTLFEARVEAEPDAVALLWNGEETTYEELNRSANRLARHLRSLGVGPEDRVGLCLGRSPRLVAAVLATLKAGAGYLPLDPHYPSERLAFLLADAGVKVLVSERSVAEHLPAELAGPGTSPPAPLPSPTQRPAGRGEKFRMKQEVWDLLFPAVLPSPGGGRTGDGRGAGGEVLFVAPPPTGASTPAAVSPGRPSALPACRRWCRARPYRYARLR
ncbi:MAG TPA: AMP-binding protein [Thermoanaerobaculia bacterium]